MAEREVARCFKFNYRYLVFSIILSRKVDCDILQVAASYLLVTPFLPETNQIPNSRRGCVRLATEDCCSVQIREEY